MDEVTIWHNPRCSKSRQTLQLLEKKGVPFHVREYLDDTPSHSEILNVLDKLEVHAADLIRKKEPVFKELKLKDKDEETLIKAMVENPILIERPVVIKANRAVLGRPPENIERLF